jgi:hypothetical protein
LEWGGGEGDCLDRLELLLLLLLLLLLPAFAVLLLLAMCPGGHCQLVSPVTVCLQKGPPLDICCISHDDE